MNEPELRFKADDGSEFPEWKAKTLSSICDIMGGGTPSTKQLEYWNGNIPWISSADIEDDNIRDINKSRYITQEAINNSATKKISKDSVLIVSRVGVGKVALADEELCTSQDYTNMVNLSENPLFIAYYMSKRMQTEAINVQGTSIKGIPSKDIQEYLLKIPCEQEQQKIADLFSTLDNVIDSIQKEVDSWEQMKRGVMQKLFSQEVRFKADDGTEFPEWEEKTLGSLGTFLKGAPLSKADISETGIPVILYGELYTTYGEVTNEICSHTNTRVNKKYYSQTGDVIIPTSGETPEEISKATCVMIDNVILAGDLNIYRTVDDIDGRMMSYLLNHQINKEITKIAQGKSIVHIQAKDLSKLSICCPCLEEQQKIADCLSEFDSVIEKTKQKCGVYKQLKKGLMQQMFA